MSWLAEILIESFIVVLLLSQIKWFSSVVLENVEYFLNITFHVWYSFLVVFSELQVRFAGAHHFLNWANFYIKAHFHLQYSLLEILISLIISAYSRHHLHFVHLFKLGDAQLFLEGIIELFISETRLLGRKLLRARIYVSFRESLITGKLFSHGS